ncbi:peptide/nickel transport system permease protein [Propionibacteriaceae bacterium ES.041]|uniref:ABC transporter permease n=1 Tax=Enemella evansiae TaxID=2016499 RepID=UPI000B97CAC2|nr:ABC transporter permease [Enemella evansiae]OYN98153.1 ABC transporter permease [Enemella evansiae]OYO02334.1 ABC transporter permease [Enemella evansiae]PFG67052.1 peptide/nickel transport system permease protein [Propionibacteriaceae bacterium ES.041]
MGSKWVLWFVLRRLLLAVPLVLAVVVVNFVLIKLAPGDPVTVLIGDQPASPEYIAQIRAQYGLDKPMLEQLLIYLQHVLQGDLGQSLAQHQAVSTLLIERLGQTLRLTSTALAIAIVIGVLLGILAARFRGGPIDGLTQTTTLLGFSVPEFWLGQLLIVVFAVTLGWLPSGGAQPVRGSNFTFAQLLPYLVLPALALSFRYTAIIGRMTRSAMLDVSGSEYITAARSRGLLEGQVLRRHMLRNIAPPVVTVIGYNLGFILAGSVMIETVFSWPGIGRLLYESISKRDYPVMTGILLMISICVVLANLITDILHVLLDPRVARE